MQHKIAIGLSTAAGILVAAASLIGAIIASGADISILGFSDTTLAKISGVALLVVSIGRYLQSIARELGGGGDVPPSDTPPADPDSLGGAI